MREVSWLVLLCAAVSAAILPVHGQVKAYTQPISRDTVVLRLTIGTEPARIGVQNGAMARVAVKNGPTLGLVPVIRGSAVDLILVEIRVDPLTANEGVRQLATRRLEKGTFQRYPEGGTVIDAELVEINPPNAESNGPAGPCTTCCVTCGSVSACACWVIMDCGRCCCDTACKCWESSGSPQSQTLASGGCNAGVGKTNSKR
jgi:hypothetical protein